MNDLKTLPQHFSTWFLRSILLLILFFFDFSTLCRASFALCVRRGEIKALVMDRAGTNIYCSISFNSAGPVTRDGPAEILVSALS
jgi:hypothetical protein